jgi:hypothetical protein
MGSAGPLRAAGIYPNAYCDVSHDKQAPASYLDLGTHFLGSTVSGQHWKSSIHDSLTLPPSSACANTIVESGLYSTLVHRPRFTASLRLSWEYRALSLALN